MVDLSQEEAREALAQIDQVTLQMRRTVGSGPMGYQLIQWGLIWILAFLLGFLYPPQTGRIWGILASLGALGSLGAGLLSARHPTVTSAAARKLGLQILWFWLAVMGFAMVFGFVLRFRSHTDQLIFFVATIMLAYVVMGIWLRSTILGLIGLVVAAAAVVARLCVPTPYISLWMALFGGGSLLAGGLYVRLRWR